MSKDATKLGLATQESLTALICFHNTKQSKAARSLVAPANFDPYYRRIVEMAADYWTKYKTPPDEHTIDIIEQLKQQSPDKSIQYDHIRESLYQIKDNINHEFVLKDAGLFVRRQRALAAIQKAIPLLKKPDDASVQQGESLLLSLKNPVAEITSPGILLNDASQALTFLDDSDDDIFTCGIKEIDVLQCGPARKQLWIGAAFKNRGKSWLACHIGKHGLRCGRRVLHITLEMSDKMVIRRYIQGLFSISKRSIRNIDIVRFNTSDGDFVNFDIKHLEERPHFKQSNIRRKLVEKMKPLKQRAPLLVKQFPSGQLDVRTLNSFLDHLAAVHGFVPDIIVLDYLGLMDLDPKHKRESMGKTCVDLRGIAVERNIAMVTFAQLNRSSESAKISGMGKLAEDISLGATADNLFTLNQTEAEKEQQLMRIYAAKVREEVSSFQVLISQALDIGQFCMDSWLMKGNTYWSSLEGDGKDEDDDD